MAEQARPSDLLPAHVSVSAADAEWLEALATQKRLAAGDSTSLWAVQQRAEATAWKPLLAGDKNPPCRTCASAAGADGAPR